jgi:trigger factor
MKVAAALAFFLALSTNRAFSPLSHAFLPRQTLVRLLATAEGASKSILKRLPESAVEVTLTIPGAATQAAYDKACGEVSKKISIPGFRKGARIPPKVLEQSLAAEGGRTALREEAIRSLLAQLIEPAIKEDHGLEPIGRPTLVTPAEELAQKFEPGEPLALGVKCDVWPDISWKGDNKPYMGLSATYKRKPPNQEKLDTALKDLRDRYARLEPLEAGAELAMGDACVVNMEGFMAQADGSKGEPLPNAASGDHVEIVLGKGRYMEGLVEGLIGAKVGDTCTVTVSFPTVRFAKDCVYIYGVATNTP